jgi:hypothetical protein
MAFIVVSTLLTARLAAIVRFTSGVPVPAPFFGKNPAPVFAGSSLDVRTARRFRETSSACRHQSRMHNSTTTRSPQIVVSWLLQFLVAGILLQTLFFKFTGAEESVYIFRTVGAEPWGRIGSGIIELIASILLLAPSTIPIGALLVLATMSGAILSHLTVLGIEVKGDGGLLFGLALVAFVSSGIILTIRRPDIPVFGRYFRMA